MIYNITLLHLNNNMSIHFSYFYCSNFSSFCKGWPWGGFGWVRGGTEPGR